MSSEAMTLLNETLNSDGANSNSLVLTVDESTRTIICKDELLLGVEHDHQAERIYFKAPRYLSNDIDLNSENVKIHINYKNAINNQYSYECTDKELQDDYVIFSWLLSEYVTAAKGTVKFNVCVENMVDTTTDVILDGNMTSENLGLADEDGDIAIYTVPNYMIDYEVTSGVVTGFYKDAGESDFETYDGVGATFKIFINGSTTASISGMCVDNGQYVLSDSELAILANAETISIQCTSTANIVEDSYLESTYYKVEFTFTINGTGNVQVVQNEWHTTHCEGKVLIGLEETDRILEDISEKTSSIYALMTEIDELNAKLNDSVVGYTKGEINTKFASFEQSIKKYLAEKYLALTGGAVSGNIVMKSGAAITNPSANSGFGFNDLNEATILNKNGRYICICTDEFDGNYLNYNFPTRSGTVALLDDISDPSEYSALFELEDRIGSGVANNYEDLSAYMDKYNELMIAVRIVTNANIVVGIANNDNEDNSGFLCSETVTGGTAYLEITMRKTSEGYYAWNVGSSFAWTAISDGIYLKTYSASATSCEISVVINGRK